MKILSLFLLTFGLMNFAFATDSQNVTAQDNVKIESCDQAAAEAPVEATAFAKLVNIDKAFCTGSCERDFDCPSGCSCAMNGSCH